MLMKMDRSTPIHLSVLAGLCLLTFLSLFASSVQAATPAGWIDQQAELVSPEAAALVLEQRQQSLIEQRVQQAQRQAPLSSDSVRLSAAEAPISSAMAMTASAEYSQLAEALENDPRRIYQFIRNHFKYEPYYGALKGAFLTLKERSGNDFDQAALLVELLRAAGYTANFQYGTMDIPHSAVDNLDTAHWLGSEADANVVGGIIATGGIPATNYIDHMVMDRVWVVVDIDGTPYPLDPAFKPSTKHSSIDLEAAMGYDQTALLNAAGGLLGTNSIEGLNSSNLNGTLDSLTAQLLNNLKQNHPNAHLHDIIGGLTIIPDNSNILPNGLAFPVTTTLPAWTDIPTAYLHTIRIQHGGIDTTLDIPTIAGKKLSIQYAGDSTVIDPPPANAADFGTVNGDDVSPIVYTVTRENPNSVTVQVTSTITGTNASAFSFTQGGGVQNVAAGGSVDIKVNFMGQGQSSGRKNATLTIAYSHNGNVFSTSDKALTGVVQSTPIAKIYLDDTLLIDEGTPTGNLTHFIISIDHPYAGSNGTFSDQTATFILKRSGTYVLASGFGGDRNSTLIAERQRQLDQMLLQGLPDSDPAVLTETLNIIGQNWFKQTQLNAELLGQLSDHRILSHHRFGMVGQDKGYFVDIKAQVIPTLALTANAAKGAFQASGLIASAMEHSVLEQLQGADKPAISTIKIFNLNNQNGDKFFLANQANFGSIQGQLTGYSTNNISSFQSAVNNNGTLIIPQNGQLSLNQWTGNGYVDYRVNGTNRSLGMIISGGLNGGFVGQPGPASAIKLAKATQSSTLPPGTVKTRKAADPVDLGSGAYLNLATDLSLGGSGARGLSFGRSYNSQQVNLNQAYMAPGWTHSYAISLDEHSDLDSALGNRTPQDAAALLVSAYISRDLMQATQPSLKAWVTSALIAQWATDQLLDKAVSIKLGDRVLTYRQQPDGSFTPPPGITTNLIKQTNGTYQLQERFGTVLTFNAANTIQSLTDIDGNSLSFTYTGDKLTQVKDTYNRTLTLGYNASNQLNSVSDNQGRSVSYTYNANGDLTQYHDAENKPWLYGYDTQHQIKTVTDPVNVVIVDNIYDEKGRVVQQTAPRDNSTTALYKLHYTGLSASEEDPLGHRITYHYDFTGRTIKTENALGHSSQVSYDGQGHIIQSTDAKGNTSTQSYDAHNNLIQSENALNQIGQLSYDSQYRLTQVTDALNHSAQISYDTKNHPLTATDAENNQTGSSYQTDGLVNSSTDARNTTTVYTYNSLGQPQTTKTATHPAVSSQYDAIGQLSSLTDQAGATTAFSYDQRGLTLERTDPLGQKTTSIYDDAGRITSQTDRNLDTISTSYTPSSKFKQITYPGNQIVSFNYDSRDNLVSMTDPTGITSNSYDTINRLTATSDPNGFQVQYQYDTTGNLTTLTYPGNKAVSYGYDTLNRLNSVSVDWLANTPTTTYHYDAAGRLTQTDQSNGSQSQYSYDNADRLTQLTHTANSQILASYHYTLDPNGNRTKALVEAPQLPERLINHNQSYSYNAQGNRLNSTNNATLTYDNEGQLKTKNTTNFAFDFAHRLISQGNNQYTYDGLGNRIKAIRNSIVTKYIYDAAGNLLAEADQNNVISRYYIYGQGLIGFIDVATNQLYSYHFDGTSHTVAITDQSQNTINTYAYDPYGKLMAESETIQQPFKYVGQLGVFAENNGLYYMRARYYDAEIGRFISEDPVGMAGGLNLYAYVGGNPIMLADPDGTFAIAGSIFGTLSGGVGGYIASGGNLNSALNGAIAGGIIGLVNPFASYTAGSIAGSVISGIAGQAIGLTQTNQDIFKTDNYDNGAILGSVLVGTGGAKLGYHIATRNTFLGSKIGKSGSNVIQSAEAIYGGFGAGIGEIIGTNGKSLNQPNK